MCEVHLKDGKWANELMLVLNETTEHLPIASSFGWYGHVLGREYGHFLIKVLDLGVEGQRKKGRLKMT